MKHKEIITDKTNPFKDVGLLDELKNSTKNVPSYVLEQRIKKQVIAITKQKRNIEIAKQLKRKGIVSETIAEATGLSLCEVEGLKVRKI